MENRELKPCECGGEAELVSTFVANDYDGDTFYQVSCKRCKKRGLAFGKISTEAHVERIKKAVISWNFKMFDGDDLCSMLHAAFSAIQGLSGENERLREENAEQDEAILNALKQMGEIRKEADTKNKLVMEQCDKAMESQLQMYKNNLKYFEEDYKKKIDMYMEATGLKQIKADTVRKYREKLYRELDYLGVKDKFNKEFFLTKADQVAKEMLEEIE